MSDKYVPRGDKWVEAAKVVLRGEYPTKDFDLIDEWPTLHAPETLFSLRKVTMRADLGIVPRRQPRNGGPLNLDELVAVVEIGDISSPRKFEQWQSALKSTVRLIWIPKLDLIELLWPEANRFRYKPGPFSRHAVLHELQLQLKGWTEIRVQQEKTSKIVKENAVAACRMLRDAAKAMEETAYAFGAVHEKMEQQRRQLQDVADCADALVHTSGLALPASATPNNVAADDNYIAREVNDVNEQ